MDRQQLLEVIPHYAAMILLLFLVLIAVNTVFGEVGFWIELLIVVAVAILYRPVVLRLGVAPSAWERR